MSRRQHTPTRARWAATAATLMVAMGVIGAGSTAATIDSGPRAVFVPITPCRLIDTRPAPDTVGGRTTPLGSGETLTLQVTGTNGNCTIPGDATAVAANVVAVQPSHDGFITLWRDYFDWTTSLAASAKGLGGVLRSALSPRPRTRTS